MIVASEIFDSVILTAFPILKATIIRISSPTESKKMCASLAQETLSQANSFSSRGRNREHMAPFCKCGVSPLKQQNTHSNTYIYVSAAVKLMSNKQNLYTVTVTQK